MTVEDLIYEVVAVGGEIWANGDHLELSAPRPLPEALVDRIRVHKSEILAALQSEKADRVAELAGKFYNHLFGVGKQTCCCYAPAGRYCPEGEQLRHAYRRACS